MPIEKRQLDQKTYELYNTDRDPKTPITQAAQDAYDEIQRGDVARRMFEEEVLRAKHRVAGEEEKPGYNSVQDFLSQIKTAPPEKRQEWKDQFKTFDKTLKGTKDPLNDSVSGIQELIDNGALYMADGEVFSAIPRHGKANQRILDASRQWGDWWRDQVGAGESINSQGQPDNSRASAEMDNHMKMLAGERVVQEIEGGMVPVMNEDPTIGTRALGSGIRDQISATKRLGWRNGEG